MLTLFFTIIALLSSSESSWAERPIAPRDGMATLGSEVRYFSSKANYRTNASSYSLFPGGYFQTTQGEVNASFEWRKTIRAFSSISFGQTDSSDGVVTRSQMGVSEFGLGAQYWFKPGAFYLVPQVSILYPFSRVSEGSYDPLLSDGSMRVEGGAYGIWKFSLFQPFGYGGYAYRDSGRSSLLTYSAGIYWRPSIVWLQGEYRGYTSVSKDSDSNNRIQRETFLARVDGASYRYYAVNPTLNEAVVSGGVYMGGGWKIYGAYAMTVSGNDAANGWTVSGGVNFGFRVMSPQANPGDITGPVEVPTENFHPEDEKYDESLFDEDPNVKRKVRKDMSVDRLLNDTEKELNQKDNKKPQ